MITDIKKILNELSYRVHDGSPDFENEQHLIKLYDVLKEFKWPVDARIELIKTLTLTEGTWWDKLDGPGKAKYIAKHGGPPKHRDAKDLGDTKDKQSTHDEPSKKSKPKQDEPKKKSKKPTESSKTSNQNTSDREKRFKRGWKKGAPGNSGSMLNEEGSNHISEQMFEDESITEEQAVNLLLKDIEGTKLAEDNQSETIAGDLKVSDLPPDTPKERRGIVSKAILAVRNGKRKSAKAKKHAEKHGWKNTKLMNFGGEQSDKDKQIEFLKGKKVVAFKNGKKVEIPFEKAQELIQSAGKGKNPSDTSSIIVNEDTGEVTLLFHSDKDSRTAQTGNSTQREELTGKSTTRALNKLEEDGRITKEQEESISDTRDAYAQRIDDIEDEFKTRATNVSKKAMEMLDSGEVDAQDVIDNFKKTSGSKGNEDKYWKSRVVGQFGKDSLNEKNKKGEPTAKAKKAQKWLESGNPDGYDNPPTDEQMVRAYFKKNSEEVPTGKDKAVLGRLNSGEDTPKRQKAGTVVKGFEFTPDSAQEIEEIRTRALEMELQQKQELNETKIEVDGKEMGMGDYLSSESIWDFAHMDMLTQTEGTVHEYDDMFEVNMSGHYLNKEVLASCLGVNTKTDFQKRFYTGDLVAQQDTEGNVTGAGKIIYFMKGKEKSDDDMAFQEKKIRTKQGPESKASTVYSNGTGLKDCIDKNGKS
jgi:hypothetical protein